MSGFPENTVRFSRLYGAQVFVGRRGWVSANMCPSCNNYFAIGTLERHLLKTKCGIDRPKSIGVIGKVGGPGSAGDGDYDANARADL